MDIYYVYVHIFTKDWAYGCFGRDIDVLTNKRYHFYC